MVKKLDKELNLRAHYSDHQIDPFSRLASDATMEELRDYYLSRVSIEYDDYTWVLIIKSEGFDPQMSQALTSMLVHEGELFLHVMARPLARDQVEFREKQVSQMHQEAITARPIG